MGRSSGGALLPAAAAAITHMTGRRRSALDLSPTEPIALSGGMIKGCVGTEKHAAGVGLFPLNSKEFVVGVILSSIGCPLNGRRSSPGETRVSSGSNYRKTICGAPQGFFERS